MLLRFERWMSSHREASGISSSTKEEEGKRGGDRVQRTSKGNINSDHQGTTEGLRGCEDKVRR